MLNGNVIHHRAQTTGFVVIIGNIVDLISILRMLVALLSGAQTILLSGTQTMEESTTQIRGHSVENGQGKIKNLHYTVIF